MGAERAAASSKAGDLRITYTPRAPEDFPRWRFPTLDFEYHARSRSVWMFFRAEEPPCFTFQTLVDMADIRESLRRLFASDRLARFPIRYFAIGSHKPGVFNLGGDLAMFARSIRDGDRELLRGYAHACIDVVYGLSTAFDLPIVTLAAISGQALGGGLEASLAQDYILAEETAKLGVPEVAFNTFPGMGAVSLLTRRLGAAAAEEIIETGHTYSAREMLDIGVVDMVVPEGAAHQHALAWMTEGGEERYVRRLALATARRQCFPISFDELIHITDLWADCSADITVRDLRHMERLIVAQQRLSGRQAEQTKSIG